MQNLYEVLQNPTAETLRLHSIGYFDDVIRRYPKHYEKIIFYINDCFNYHSPLLTEEKDWAYFTRERFAANNLPDHLEADIIDYESEEVVFAISSFLAHQKQPAFTTLIAKQNLRVSMLGTMQKSSSSISDKKNANEIVSSLDIEINDILEKLRQGQKVFGNFKGYDQVKSARNKHKINIANFID